MRQFRNIARMVFAFAILFVATQLLDSWMAKAGVGAALILNTATLQALFQGFKQIFQQAFNAAQPQYAQIALEVPSNAEQEVYAWMGAFPKLREWVGERVIANLKASDWTIKNKDWESTVAVPRNKIMFDTYGIFKPMFEAMGASSRMHPDELVFDLLNNGFTNKGYDGKTFFATDHPSGSNKGTAALAGTSLAAGIAAMKRVKDAKGKPLFNGSEKLYLITGPELDVTAAELCNATYVVGADGKQKENVLKGKATPLSSPLITSTTAWFLVASFNGLKPLVFQRAKDPEFIAKEDPTSSDHVFMKKEYLYGVDSIDNAGYGLNELAYGSTGAA